MTQNENIFDSAWHATYPGINKSRQTKRLYEAIMQLTLERASQITWLTINFINWYTGHCPRYKERIGETYSQATHRALVKFSTQLASHEFGVTRDVIPKPPRTIACLYNPALEVEWRKPPFIPGYEGFLPGIINIPGKTYGRAAVESDRKTRRKMMEDREYRRRLWSIAGKPPQSDVPYRKPDISPMVEVMPEFRGLPLKPIPEMQDSYGGMPLCKPCTPPKSLLKCTDNVHNERYAQPQKEWYNSQLSNIADKEPKHYPISPCTPCCPQRYFPLEDTTSETPKETVCKKRKQHRFFENYHTEEDE